ncbi:hypothetical protein ACYOEI_10575, partial [Singulisphaera rosea]
MGLHNGGSVVIDKSMGFFVDKASIHDTRHHREGSQALLGAKRIDPGLVADAGAREIGYDWKGARSRLENGPTRISAFGTTRRDCWPRTRAEGCGLWGMPMPFVSALASSCRRMSRLVRNLQNQDRQWSRHAARYDELFLDSFHPGVENPLLAIL